VEAKDVEALAGDAKAYQVRVEGKVYDVEVAENGEVKHISSAASASPSASEAQSLPSGASTDVAAPLSGNIFKINVQEGATVNEGDVILILEAMKMETEVRSSVSGVVQQLLVKDGDAVQAGQTMMVIG
jgi:oxaloacetate decarboxylase alpha subunit